MPIPGVAGPAHKHKRGVWNVDKNGSGTFTRHDKQQIRCRTLLLAGPSRHEVYKRCTYDTRTGDLLETLSGYDTAKILDQLLPEPVPRDITTVFHFQSTASKIPSDAVGPAQV